MSSVVKRHTMTWISLTDLMRSVTAPTDFELLHYEECAIYQASRILYKIDKRWPTPSDGGRSE